MDIPAGNFIIGFNASSKILASSAAVAIDDVTLLEGECSTQGTTLTSRNLVAINTGRIVIVENTTFPLFGRDSRLNTTAVLPEVLF